MGRLIDADELKDHIKIFNIGCGCSEDYQKSFSVKKIISLIIILGLDVFFFYYTMGFCAVYRNTQYGWFYSVIWAMLFNWTLYGIFYIFVISLIESFGGVKCAYYMKRLFIF